MSRLLHFAIAAALLYVGSQLGGGPYDLQAADSASGDQQESAASQSAWQELFNGRDMTGWQDASGGTPRWVVEDGALVRKDRAGSIWTKERFGDFVLSIEFRTEANSGIFFRTDNPRDCVQTGIEIQVLPPRSPSKHSCGAVYDLLAPSKEASKADAWNRAVIKAVDNRIAVKINGEQVIDMDLDQWTEAGKNPDGTKNKFRRALAQFKREGHIGLQDHGGKVAYRNIKIRKIEPK